MPAKTFDAQGSVSDVRTFVSASLAIPVKQVVLLFGSKRLDDAEFLDTALGGLTEAELSVVISTDYGSKQCALKRQAVVDGFEKKGLKRSLAEELERGMYYVVCPKGEILAEGSNHFKEYKYQYKRICTHLRHNGALGRRLSSGDVQARKAAAMLDEELVAEDQKKEREQHRKACLQDAMGELPEHSPHWTPTRSYKCTQCHQSDCIYLQTEKAMHAFDDNNVDQPTMTVRCLGCKHVWREDEVTEIDRKELQYYEGAQR